MTRLFAAVGVLVVLAIAALVVLGYTAFGNQFLADQIASRVSTPDMQVRIEGVRGLLAGNFRIDRVTFGDTKGTFAEVEKVAVDWSPWSLLTGQFEAEQAAASSVKLNRQPIQTIESEPSEANFGLPVEIDIRQLRVPSLSLGKDMLGRAAEIALDGSAHGAVDRIALTLNAVQKDEAGARARADLAYAVNARTLKLSMDVSEPKGGLLGTVLQLPDNPAIDIAVNGDGPLDSWAGKIRANLDGQPRLALDGSHLRNKAGIHRVVLSGGGAIGDLMPPAFRALFEGESVIDVDASFSSEGMLDIRSAKLSNGSLSLDIGGSVDPKGGATLNGSLRPANDIVPFRWPVAQGMLAADIRNVALTASGPFRSVAFEISADLKRAAVPAGAFEDTVLRIGSDGFNLATRSGQLSTELSAESAVLAAPQLAKLVRGPIRVTAPITVAGSSLKADPVAISSGAIGGTARFAYELETAAIDLDFKTSVVASALLPPDIAARAGNTVGFSGKLTGTPDHLAFNDIQLTSAMASAKVDGTFIGNELTASLAGDIPSLSAFGNALDGRVSLTAKLTGPLSDLKIDSAAKAKKMVAADRTLEDVEFALSGQLGPAGLKGTTKTSLSLDGEPVSLSADLAKTSDGIAISAIDAKIGGNSLAGAIDLGTDFLPTGRLNAKLTDLATLSRLAGQSVEGDLDLVVDLKPSGGKLTASISGGGDSVATRGMTLTSPAVKLASPDVLAQLVKGEVRARSLELAGNRIENFTLSADRQQPATTLAIGGRFDGAPVAVSADIQQVPAGMDIMVRDLKVTPRGLPLALAEPAFVLFRDGKATIEKLSIAIGSGRITLAGSAGEALDLDAVATAVPASVANSFAPGLDASGTLDAKATISGKATSPVIHYEFSGKALTAAPLVQAGRRPLDLAGKGTLDNNLLHAETTISGIDETGELATKASIRLGSDIRIEQLELASETLNGSLSGSFQPATQALQAAFQLDLTGKRLLPPNLLAKLTPPIRLTGTIEGTPDNLAFRDVKVSSNLLAATLSGSLNGGVIDAAITADLPDLSVFQPNIAGSANLAASLSGPVAAPSIKAELSAANATLAGRALQSLTVKLDAVADRKAPTGTLTATGTLDGQRIDVSGDITSEQGLLELPALKAVIGRNTLTAGLEFNKAFIPKGRIEFDLPDLGLLAALGGQRAQGDLKGNAHIDDAGGKLSATIKAEGSGITAEGLSVRTPSIDLNIPDLFAGQVSGKVTASELSAGTNLIKGLDATFALQGPRTDFVVAANYDGAPLKLDGAVLRTGNGLEITLDRFSAAPRKLPVALASPATIRIADGVTDLGNVSLAVAGGRVNASGTIADRLDLKVDAPALPVELANIISPSLDAAGSLDVHATISGTAANPIADLTLEGKQLTVRPLRDAGRDPLDIKASGHFENNALSLDADVAGIRELGPSHVTSNIVRKNGALSVNDLALTSPVLTARGNAVLNGDRLGLRLAGEIKELAALLPQAKARVAFSVDADGPLKALPIKARFETRNALMAGKTLGQLVIDATAIADPAKPTAKLTATGEIDRQKIDASAEVVSENGHISIPAIKANVGRNTITGAIRLTAANLPTGKLSFDLPDISLLAALGGQVASGQLRGSVDLAEVNGKISAAVKADGEGVTAQGIKAGKPQIDLKVPDLLTGQVSGAVIASDIVSGANRITNLNARFTRAGATTDFDVKGNYDGAPLTMTGALETKPEGMVVTLNQFSASPRKISIKLAAPVTINTGAGDTKIKGLRITAGKGSITVDGVAGEKLDLKIKVAALPASLANTFASGLDASGTIGADATVTGSTANPQVDFTVDWQNALTSQLRAAGLSAVVVKAKGKLRGTRISLDTDVRGSGGLTLNASGTVDTGGSQALNLSVKGQLPFAAVAGQLAAQGLALKGNANFDLKIGGSTARPTVTGRITTANSQFIAIRQNLVVNNVAAAVNLSGQTATIESLSGNLQGGGKISGSGTVGFAPGSGLPADLKIKLDRATYADGRVVVAKVSGDLTVSGPLQREPVLGGTIRLRRADITIPERLPASLANANVKHKNAPADVLRQSREIRADATSKADKDKASGIRLDMRIIAPRQIFVRGRGLDAELGGEVRVAGSSSAPSVSGGFKMIRGRLTLISRRLDFTTGEITFGGGLVPYLNMVASTTVNATTLNVNVTGLANDPAFSFTSSPALPQDEVLAQLIFGRESSSLSPFQIAQLADAVATLSGGQRTSLFNKLRQGLGVDDLNVGTDENGGAQVTAGKYINRRTYLEVMQGEDPSKSGVAINLDVGKGVKLRGQATQDGGTATGIFFEKEY